MAKPRTYKGEKQRRVRTRDPTGPARWAYWRRQYNYNRCERPGFAQGTRDALQLIHQWILECRRKHCGALVAWRRAKIEANKKPQARMRLGAGCGSPCCSRGQRVSRFHAHQRKLARKLLDGSGILVEWPEDADDCDVWQRPAAAAHAAATRALARGAEATDTP